MTKIPYNFRNIIHNKYGKLTVIKRLDSQIYFNSNKRKCTRSLWLCVCDCGGTTKATTNNLTSGNTTSCGCAQKEAMVRFNKSTKPVKEYNNKRSRYTKNKYKAKERNLEFTLSYEEFLLLSSSDCFYCGISPCQQELRVGQFKKPGSFVYNGIDRVDNNKGYIIENCVSCCKHCNVMKLQQTQDEFLARIKRVYERHCK